MLNFIITYWDNILIAISGIVSGASALTAITPSTTDDKILNSVKKGLNILALNIGNAKTVAA